MSDKKIGSIEWRDLTVEHADEVKDFYAKIVGWETEPVSMGDYDDFNINVPDSGETVAGICHARGANAEIPPQWMMYVRVADAAQSANKAVNLGGEVIAGPRSMGGETYFTIRDPAGAVITIFS